jgi:hypothetical protein
VLTQRDLARRLNVHESQISCDERNEYFGITFERAATLGLLQARPAVEAVCQSRRPAAPSKSISTDATHESPIYL